MKERGTLWVGTVLVIVLATMLWVSCDNITGGITNPVITIDDPTGFQPDPVDPAFWFGEIHDALIARVGTVTSKEYTGDMGQIVNCQYVCNAINAKWKTSYVPAAGTENQVANCKYLLQMIDKANRNTTTFGTSSYATMQVLDKTAVDMAVQTLWKPAGKFVAVAGGDNKAAYSTDGINWTAATLPSSTYWYGVTYGNGKFVAVASGDNKAAYSTDGINWTAATLPSSTGWYSVTYGNGKFVVLTDSDKAAYSTDGINWTAATMPSSAHWHGVTYGNGKFVAVASGDNKAAYSTDGINWTAATLPSSTYWYDVTYGGE